MARPRRQRRQRKDTGESKPAKIPRIMNFSPTFSNDEKELLTLKRNEEEKGYELHPTKELSSEERKAIHDKLYAAGFLYHAGGKKWYIDEKYINEDNKKAVLEIFREADQDSISDF